MSISDRFAQAGRGGRRKGRGCGCGTLIGLIILVLIGFASAGAWGEYLWFVNDVRHPEVFLRRYETESVLFGFSFVLVTAILWISLGRAVRLSMVYLRMPSTPRQMAMSNLVGAIQDRGPTIVRFLAPIIAFFVASDFAGDWNTYLLASHARSFGLVDPIFGRDLGFFVFTLPWYRAVANLALGVMVLTGLATLGVYVGMQALAALAKIELSRPQVRSHLSFLGGLTLLALAAQHAVKLFEFGLTEGRLFTGAGYADMQELGAMRIVIGLLAISGVLFLVGTWAARAVRGGAMCLVATVAFWVLGAGIWPSFVQGFKVEPNKLTLEAPYADRAIRMTRYGFGLDKVEQRDFAVRDEPTTQEIADSKTTLDNMRLWDPTDLGRSLDSIQTLKPYYHFSDVDVDRYRIGGRQQTVMVSPRDIRLQGLSAQSSWWLNERLQYTHGYGLTVSPVNAADPIGQPTFMTRDIPVRTIPELAIDRPQIYFSDFRGLRGEPEDEYALVDTDVKEFDYPTEEGSNTHRWAGLGGIPVGTPWLRLLYSAALKDGNLLISGNITSRSRLLMHRGVLDRAQLLYPFLKFDPDPYIVILGGKLVWVLDGYTMTDMIPYSHIEEGAERLNYARNPAKVTIDAYTGEPHAYAIQPDEPILAAYRSIYPGLVSDASELPAGLEAHFRYPEQLLMLQARQLTQYHVTDPGAFLANNDAWDLPLNRGMSGNMEPLEAYYVQMRLPDEPREGFMLILPFTPRQRNNMNGWLAAHCDPGDYGKLVLYRFTKGTNVPGPAQMESNFSQNAEIANINRQLTNDQSQIIVGNLLVVPIGQSVMYVEPMFLASRTVGIAPIPQLKKVILALKDKVVVGESYAEALAKLFPAATAPAPQQAPPQPSAGKGFQAGPPKAPAVPSGAAAEALKLFDEADQALRAGDFAKYGEVQKRLREKLKSLAGK